MSDPRQFAPATARNRDPILEVLRRVAPPSGTVLEVASGSGEHAAYFAAALPGLTFQPSDADPARRASIDAWCAGIANVRPAIALDAAAPVWPKLQADLVLCCNMTHIAPWIATDGLVEGAGRVLNPGGVFVLYGPFRRGGKDTAPSNTEFDAKLRAENPAWGIRDLEDIAFLAMRADFAEPEIVEMPANNLCVVWRR